VVKKPVILKEKMAKRKLKKRRSYQHKEKPENIFKQMTRDHLDVLHDIEFSIVSTCCSHSEIDDRMIASALRSVLNGSVPADRLSAALVNDLARTREMRARTTEDIWFKGIKVVLQSVNNHSDKKPGTRDYLDFAGAFLS